MNWSKHRNSLSALYSVQCAFLIGENLSEPQPAQYYEKESVPTYVCMHDTLSMCSLRSCLPCHALIVHSHYFTVVDNVFSLNNTHQSHDKCKTERSEETLEAKPSIL